MDKSSTSHRGGQAKYWVVQNHDEMSVEEGSERPNYPDKPGERQVVIHGPYKERKAAQERADYLTSKTLRVQNAQGGA